VKPIRRLNRRSFIASVGGLSALALTGCVTPRTETEPYDPLEDAAPRDRGRVRPGGDERSAGCTDGDSGSRSDPPGRGRRCTVGQTRSRNGRH
jgi:hypothetical protein